MMSSQPIAVDDVFLEEYPAIIVGPSMYRKFECSPGCSACCLQGPLSLDFIPTERAWLDLPAEDRQKFSERSLTVNGKEFTFWSLDKPKGMCHFLRPRSDGLGNGCGIWQTHPLECWSAGRLQFQRHKTEAILLKKGFAREWRWEVRAQCKYPEFSWDLSELEADTSVLRRYFEYANYFGILTKIHRVVDSLSFAYLSRDPSPVWIPLR